MNIYAPNMLQAVIETIVQVVQPEQVILFGSRGRGTAREESDYDLLVTVAQVTNERQVSRRIYRALLDRGLGVAVDVVVASTTTLQRYGDSPFFIYRGALEEGQVFYDRVTSR